MIHGIDHTALSVPDFDKALDFYCGVLGFEAEFKAGWPKGAKPLDDLVGLRDSASKVAMLKLGDTKIEVFQYENPVGKAQDPQRPVSDHGIIHLCLRVTDIQSEYARLRDAGVRFNSPPIDLGREICVYGRDPFGNVLELLEKKQKKQ
jgi:catechol 2,3-dioxygenase-like lactoylglutathione lyase family enzyme